MQCTRCSLQIANPMTDKIQVGESCTYPAGANECRSVYHSCTDIAITGTIPRTNYVCPTTPPIGWIQQPPVFTPAVYTQTAALPGAWSAAGWLTTAPEQFRQDCGICSVSKAPCPPLVGGELPVVVDGTPTAAPAEGCSSNCRESTPCDHAALGNDTCHAKLAGACPVGTVDCSGTLLLFCWFGLFLCSDLVGVSFFFVVVVFFIVFVFILGSK